MRAVPSRISCNGPPAAPNIPDSLEPGEGRRPASARRPLVRGRRRTHGTKAPRRSALRAACGRPLEQDRVRRCQGSAIASQRQLSGRGRFPSLALKPLGASFFPKRLAAAAAASCLTRGQASGWVIDRQQRLPKQEGWPDALCHWLTTTLAGSAWRCKRQQRADAGATVLLQRCDRIEDAKPVSIDRSTERDTMTWTSQSKMLRRDDAMPPQV